MMDFLVSEDIECHHLWNIVQMTVSVYFIQEFHFSALVLLSSPGLLLHSDLHLRVQLFLLCPQLANAHVISDMLQTLETQPKAGSIV